MISGIGGGTFAAYAVWEPILKTDDERSSRKAAALFPDERVRSYWAPVLAVGRLFQPPINLTTEPAWDVYLVYGPDVIWDGDAPPAPTFFMHQLSGRLPDDRRLHGPTLRDRIESILKDP